MKLVGYIIAAALALTRICNALTEYYIDPDYTGTESGTASQPWQDLDGQWTTINTSLASDDVTVYFSARDAGSDVHQATTTNIQIERTDAGANRLTLDGMAKYNSNDSTPSWSSYSGTSRFQVTATNPVTTQNSATEDRRDYVTVRGIRAIAVDGQCFYLKSVRNCILEHCYGTSNVGATTGPGVLITYEPNTVANANATKCQNVTVRNCTIESNYGEGLYVNGPKETSDTHGIGPSNIQILNNVFIDVGARGGEGDSIDIKNYVFDCVVRGNSITGGEIGVTSHSSATIERNLIITNDGSGAKSGIRVNNGGASEYATVDSSSLTGAIVRNNIIIDPSGVGVQITSNGDDAPVMDYHQRDALVENNTIYGGTKCIVVSSETTGNTINNNIGVESDNQCFDADAGTVSTHDYNLFWRTVGGNIVLFAGSNYTAATLTGLEANSQTTDPAFVDAGTPYQAHKFKLQAGSDAIANGLDLSGSFTTDYSGAIRDATWEIGAWAYLAELRARRLTAGTLTIGP